MGAIEYLSPEVIQGRPASRASDIWALGATLHRVLTGVSIYPELPTHSLVEALRFLLNERPVMGDALRNGERRIIETVVATDPADRPATAADLATSISDEAERQAGKIQA
jgi:serine/threonine protein kinase